MAFETLRTMRSGITNLFVRPPRGTDASAADPAAARKAMMLPGLHGLRALAALMVLLFHIHVLAQIPAPSWLPWVRWHFSLGVHLFFVLSAFSLAWANPDASRQAGPYFIKRFFRIGPLFWLMQLYFLYMTGWPSPSQAILDLTFAFNLVPGMHHSRVMAGWTIGTEMVFYAVLPLLLQIRSRLAVGVALGLTLVVSFAARVGLSAVLSGSDYALIAFVSNLSVFMAGLLAFRFFERARTTPAAERVAMLAALFALVVIGLLLSPLGARLSIPGNPDILGFGLAFGALCLWQALRPSWLLRGRPALWLGERSYSLYLLHIPVLMNLKPVYARILVTTDSVSLGFFGCVAATLLPLCLLAELTYRAIERPGMALGRRLVRRWQARHAESPA